MWLPGEKIKVWDTKIEEAIDINSMGYTVTIGITAWTWTVYEAATELIMFTNVSYVVEMTAREWIEKYCRGYQSNSLIGYRRN